ncbi:MAG: hypothetical protein CM15mP90_3050 [Actinomycetota bacterium]|nr:MAG: hypothetical protein CM15mP90_3050 [Actinomycetota bacterium]
MDDGLPKAALGGGDMWGAFNDRDATKAVAEYMLSATFFEACSSKTRQCKIKCTHWF